MDTVAAFQMKPAIHRGWMLMKRHFPAFLVLGLASAFVGGVTNALERSPFLRLLFELINIGVGMIWIRFALDADAGHPPEFASVRPTLTHYLEYLLAAIVYGVIVAVGMVLLIVPGVIAAVRFGLFPFFLLDQPVDAMGALRKSWEATRGTAWHLFLFALLLMGINLLGAIAFGIGLLVTVPTTSIAAAHVYKQLRHRIALPQGTTSAPNIPQPT